MIKVLTALSFMVALSSVGYSQTGFVDGKDVLISIKGINVVVNNADANTNEIGLTKQRIQADVELRARKAGLLVGEQVVGVLEVDLKVIKTESGLFAYSINVNFREVVELSTRNVAAIASIWSHDMMGVAGRSKTSVIGENIGYAVDRFINDWLAANPPRK